jgi:cytochrome P450
MSQVEPMAGARTADEVAATLFLDPASHADPYPLYDQLRTVAPRYLSPLGPYVFTRHADCDRVLRGNDFGTGGEERIAALRADWREHPAYVLLYDALGAKNPPDHTRLRALVSRAFTPRTVADLRPTITRIVTELLDGMAERGSGGAPVDFMADFGFRLPVSVIGSLLGIPAADYEWLRVMTRNSTCVFDLCPTEEDIALADTSVTEVLGYVDDLIAARRRNPASDLLSDLIAVRDEHGDRLSEDELRNLIPVLFVAGFDTTTNLLGNTLVGLWRHPEQADALRTDPALAEAATEEFLRYDSPVQIATRVAHTDVDLGDLRVEAGMLVTLLTGAGNRDPERFTDPHRLDLRRGGVGHLTLGAGIHYCLGAALARAEIGTAVPALLRRFPRLAPAGEQERRPGLSQRGYDRIPVHTDAG